MSPVIVSSQSGRARRRTSELNVAGIHNYQVPKTSASKESPGFLREDMESYIMEIEEP